MQSSNPATASVLLLHYRMKVLLVFKHIIAHTQTHAGTHEATPGAALLQIWEKNQSGQIRAEI